VPRAVTERTDRTKTDHQKRIMAFAIQALAGSSSVVAAYSDPPALERQPIATHTVD
jgi:hypothetical protein